MALGCLLAWTALRRNDGSGLGVAYACAVGHPRRLDRVLTVVSCAVGRPIRCGRVLTIKLLRVLVLGVLGVLRAGKRQAWTPIRSLRSHCCGLGVPVGMDRAEKKRWIWPWGSLCLRGWASQTLGQSFDRSVLGVLRLRAGKSLDAHKKPQKPLLWLWGACWHGPR